MSWKSMFADGAPCGVSVVNLNGDDVLFETVMTAGDSETLNDTYVTYILSVSADGELSLTIEGDMQAYFWPQMSVTVTPEVPSHRYRLSGIHIYDSLYTRYNPVTAYATKVDGYPPEPSDSPDKVVVLTAVGEADEDGMLSWAPNPADLSDLSGEHDFAGLYIPFSSGV